MNLLADECVPDDVVARLRADGKDFGELVYRLGRAHAGVVLLRLAGIPAEERAEVVSSVFGDRAAELPGNFTVIDRDNVRVRHPRGAAGA